jgi:hypothetical protein
MIRQFDDLKSTTILSEVTDPVFVLKRIGANGLSYSFTLQARDERVYNSRLETVWDLLIGNPGRFAKL